MVTLINTFGHAAICLKWGCYKIQADDHDLLVNSDNENDDMLGYESEKYSDDEDADGTNHAEDADGTNHSDLKLVKRGITRLYKFRKEYGKPGGIKIKIENKEIEADEEPSRGIMWLKGRVNKDEFTDDEIRSVGDKLLCLVRKMEVMQVGGGKWELQKRIGIFYLLEATSNCLIRLSYFKLQLDNERRRLQAVTKDVLVKKLSTEMTEKDVLVTPMGAYEVDGNSKSNIVALGTVYKSDGKQMLHNQALPNDCYKVSIDSSLVDAACIPDVGNNGLKTVKDGVGGFFAWPKNQVVLDEEVTPPTTIQKISDYNSAPKLQSNRKYYVSHETMQRNA
ncbi:hypothetical protein Tco_1570277 [Tanacetum coccineum]